MLLLTGTNVLRVLLSAQPYKPGQGNLARKGTLVGVGVLIVGAMYAWNATYARSAPAIRWGVPVAFGLALAWVAYRLVHFPRFADFLISTEAEMNKVSWPHKQDVVVSTTVVLAQLGLMAVFLFVTDLFWRWFLGSFGFLKVGELLGGAQGMIFPPFGW